ncbi:PEP-CTERM sorting domain-containing protein [Singulisphaera rosea]
MRMVRRKSGLSTLVIAMGLTFAAGSDASASTLIQYSTSGSIDSSGVSGTPVISFGSIDSATFTPTSYFSLGNFQVASLQPGQTTTYTHTPFKITLVVDQVNGVTPDPNQSPIVLTGYLDGKITGGDKSSVQATFDPIGSIQFQTGNYQNTLTIPDLKVTLVPSTTNGGRTTAEARISTISTVKPVPEPTTAALFLTTLAGLGMRGRLRRRAA